MEELKSRVATSRSPSPTRPFMDWKTASPDLLLEAQELINSLSMGSLQDAFDRALDEVMTDRQIAVKPTPTQVEAWRSWFMETKGLLRVEWHPLNGSPASIQGFPSAASAGSEEEVFAAFLAAEGRHLPALLGNEEGVDELVPHGLPESGALNAPLYLAHFYRGERLGEERILPSFVVLDEKSELRRVEGLTVRWSHPPVELPEREISLDEAISLAEVSTGLTFHGPADEEARWGLVGQLGRQLDRVLEPDGEVYRLVWRVEVGEDDPQICHVDAEAGAVMAVEQKLANQTVREMNVWMWPYRSEDRELLDFSAVRVYDNAPGGTDYNQAYQDLLFQANYSGQFLYPLSEPPQDYEWFQVFSGFYAYEGDGYARTPDNQRTHRPGTAFIFFPYLSEYNFNFSEGDMGMASLYYYVTYGQALSGALGVSRYPKIKLNYWQGGLPYPPGYRDCSVDGEAACHQCDTNPYFPDGNTYCYCLIEKYNGSGNEDPGPICSAQNPCHKCDPVTQLCTGLADPVSSPVSCPNGVSDCIAAHSDALNMWCNPDTAPGPQCSAKPGGSGKGGGGMISIAISRFQGHNTREGWRKTVFHEYGHNVGDANSYGVCSGSKCKDGYTNESACDQLTGILAEAGTADFFAAFATRMEKLYHNNFTYGGGGAEEGWEEGGVWVSEGVSNEDHFRTPEENQWIPGHDPLPYCTSYETGDSQKNYSKQDLFRSLYLEQLWLLGWRDGLRTVFLSWNPGVTGATRWSSTSDSHYYNQRQVAGSSQYEVWKSYRSHTIVDHQKYVYLFIIDDASDEPGNAHLIEVDGPDGVDLLHGPDPENEATQLHLKAHGSAADMDFWVFRARNGETYDLWTHDLGSQADTILSLWGVNASDELVLLDQNDNCSSLVTSSCLSWQSDRDDWVYVRVENALIASSDTGYSLAAEISDDDYGDSCDSAHPLPIEGTAFSGQAAGGDYDFFSIHSPGAGTEIEVTLDSNYAKVLSWYDGDCTFVESTTSDTLTISSAPEGVFYVKVRQQSIAVPISYTISAEVPAPGPTDLPGASRSGPLVLYNGAGVDISMVATDLHDHDPGDGKPDEDWYSFLAHEGYRYTIDTFDLGSGVDTELSLFPPDLYADGFCTMPDDWPTSSWTCCGLGHDETWMLRDDDGGVEPGASHISFVAPWDGVYKVRVRPMDSSTEGPYGISLARHLFAPEDPLLEFPGFGGI